MVADRVAGETRLARELRGRSHLVEESQVVHQILVVPNVDDLRSDVPEGVEGLDRVRDDLTKAVRGFQQRQLVGRHRAPGVRRRGSATTGQTQRGETQDQGGVPGAEPVCALAHS